MYERALRGYEKALGPEHTSTLTTVGNLGLLYSDQGKLEQAEQMYERALRGEEKAVGPEHTSTLNTVNNLGLLYLKQGKTKEARNMFQRTVLGRKKILGEEHPDTLEVANLLMTLPLAVEEREEESRSTNSSHITTRKRHRWKGLLRLRGSRAGRS